MRLAFQTTWHPQNLEPFYVPAMSHPENCYELTSSRFTNRNIMEQLQKWSKIYITSKKEHHQNLSPSLNAKLEIYLSMIQSQYDCPCVSFFETSFFQFLSGSALCCTYSYIMQYSYEQRGSLNTESLRIFFKNEQDEYISPIHDIPLW